MNRKKITLSLSFILLIVSLNCLSTRSVLAEPHQGFVVDQAYLQIRRGPGSEYPIIKSVPKGSRITLSNDDIGGGYAEVILDNNIKGYALKRYLSDTPPVTERQIALKQENNKTTSHINSKSADILTSNPETFTSTQVQALINERNQLANELDTIKHSIVNALDLERQRNDLQEKLVNLERSNRHLKLENQALQNKSSHNWFLLGAGVLFAGIIIGWLLSSVGQRKKSSSWNDF